jgi:hypothetical protein
MVIHGVSRPRIQHGQITPRLTNPKYARLHRATVYAGYKPGRESPNRERPYDGDLIPCRLPALISADDYGRIVRTARARRHGQKPAVDAKA